MENEDFYEIMGDFWAIAQYYVKTKEGKLGFEGEIEDDGYWL